MHRNPHPVHFLECDPQGLDRTLEHGCKRYIENISFLMQQLAG